MATETIAVFITAGSRDEALTIAEALVEKKLAACVQVLPAMDSVYRWQGNVERQTEFLLIAKTLSSQFTPLEAEVRRLHSYDTPEIVAVPISSGSKPYLDWLSENVSTEIE